MCKIQLADSGTNLSSGREKRETIGESDSQVRLFMAATRMEIYNIPKLQHLKAFISSWVGEALKLWIHSSDSAAMSGWGYKSLGRATCLGDQGT